MKFAIFGGAAFVLATLGGTFIPVLLTPPRHVAAAVEAPSTSVPAPADSVATRPAVGPAVDSSGAATPEAVPGAERPADTTAVKPGAAPVPGVTAVSASAPGVTAVAVAAPASPLRLPPLSSAPIGVEARSYADVAKIMTNMKPTEVAPILAKMSDENVEGILAELGPRQAATLMAQLPADRAAAMSLRLIHREPKGKK